MPIKTLQRWLPVSCIVILVAIFFLLNLQQYFTLQQVKQHLGMMKQFSQAHTILAPIIVTAFYILVVAVPTPFASTVCIVLGFLFPIPAAISYAATAETVGGLILFKAVNTAFGAWLQQSASKKIQVVLRNMTTNANLYIITLRVLCFFPSAIINSAAGLIQMPATRYAFITFFSSLPAAIIFTLFGQGLEKILLSDQPITLQKIFTTPIIITLSTLIVIIIAAFLYQQRNRGVKK